MTVKRTVSFFLLAVFVSLIVWILAKPVPRSETGEEVTVLLGGDFYAGQRLRNYQVEENPEKFILGFPDVIEESDLHIVNLEAPLTTRGETTTSKRYSLRTPPSIGTVLLEELSVDAVGLANNHMLDYGTVGLQDTKRHLNQNGIYHAGADLERNLAERPVYFDREGQKLAFLSFSNTFPQSFWAGDRTAGTAYGDPERVGSAVRRARKQADRVIVSFHWGKELEWETQEYQKHLARRSIRAGADVVFGHHPHTIQSVEQYRGGLIFYSLGNYFFSTLSRDVKNGLLAEVNFPLDPSMDPQYTLHLMHVNNYQVNYRPRLVGSFDDALGLGIHLGRLNFFQRTMDPTQKTSGAGPQFSN